ncbi:MAG: DUF1573 domain-containing protein [Spirochaetales bacterium]|nr:DUF1573 domain-containing protein [Spirochaetales bacterium]
MNKKINFYFVIHICIIILFFACSGKQINGLPIKFETETYNFGEVPEGKAVEYTYVFKNTGKEIIAITEVRPSCGCTLTGDYDREVQPGASGKIPVILRTSGYQGKISKTIKVSTNVPGKEVIVLTLEGSVRTAITIEPRALWLGEIKPSATSLNGFFTIKNNSKDPLKITKITPPHERVTVTITTVKQDQEYKITITVHPPFGEGRVYEAIIVETNNPDKPSFTVQYSYNVKAELSVYPQVIFIEPGIAEEKFERLVIIENSLPEPVKIINPQIMGGTLDFEIEQLSPGKYYQIKLLFPKGFTMTGKQMLVLSFQVESTLGTDVYNIAIKPSR